jgi:hypothetical protein
MAEDLESLRRKVSELSENLQDTGFILYGTVRKHYMKCGHKGCRCHADPPQLHGPYYDWTRRVEGKTKTVRLTEDHAKIIEEWISNMRRVEKIVMEMESISVQAAAVKIKK